MKTETNEIDKLLKKGKDYIPKKLELKVNHLLWLLMERTSISYLSCHAIGREDGYLKAQCHLELCKIIIAGIYKCDIDDAARDEDRHLHLKRIHDATQELTDNLSEKIGFPLKERYPDFDKLAPLFFEKFAEIALNTD